MRIVLRRTEPETAFTDMSYFDYILTVLCVPEEDWEKIDEIEFPHLTKRDFKLSPSPAQP